MTTFKFVQRLHRLIKEFPERRKECEILFPEAFKKVDITDDVKFKLCGSTFQTFRLYDGDYYFAEMKPFVQALQVFNARKDDPEEKKIRSLACPVEPAYEIEFRSAGSYGFRIWRYGEKKIVADVEFNPDAEKNRIKEKS